MIDLISKLNPWRRIRDLEAEVENLNARVEAESIEAQYWYAKAFQFKEDLQKSNQRIAGLARDVEIHKDNAAELEMCVAELKQSLELANSQAEEFERKWYLATDELELLHERLAELKNDKRDQSGRYTK